MNHRTRRNLLSGLVLGVYAIIASGTSQNSRGAYGEFPVVLHMSGNAAFLMEEFTDAAYHNSGRWRFSVLTADGAPVLLQDMPMWYSVGPWAFASVATSSEDGPYSFLLASSDTDGSFAAVVPESGAPQTTAVATGTRLFLSAESYQLVEMPRDNARRWIYFQHADSTLDTSFLPLFEIRDGKPTVIANNVIWAGCEGELCQQVRIEKSRLHVYANSVTSQEYFSKVTESAIIGGNGHFACVDTDGTPAVVFGVTAYSLSITAPSLHARNISQVSGPCATRPAIVLSDDSNNGYSFSETFARGERITVESRAVGGKSQHSSCDKECSPVKMRIWVTIDDSNGVQLRDFPLHE